CGAELLQLLVKHLPHGVLPIVVRRQSPGFPRLSPRRVRDACWPSGSYPGGAAHSSVLDCSPPCSLRSSGRRAVGFRSVGWVGLRGLLAVGSRCSIARLRARSAPRPAVRPRRRHPFAGGPAMLTCCRLAVWPVNCRG